VKNYCKLFLGHNTDLGPRAFLVPLTIAESVDLGNPCDQVVAKISDLKILVIDNIFVLETNA